MTCHLPLFIKRGLMGHRANERNSEPTLDLFKETNGENKVYAEPHMQLLHHYLPKPTILN